MSQVAKASVFALTGTGKRVAGMFIPVDISVYCQCKYMSNNQCIVLREFAKPAVNWPFFRLRVVQSICFKQFRLWAVDENLQCAGDFDLVSWAADVSNASDLEYLCAQLATFARLGEGRQPTARQVLSDIIPIDAAVEWSPTLVLLFGNGTHYFPHTVYWKADCLLRCVQRRRGTCVLCLLNKTHSILSMLITVFWCVELLPYFAF